MLLMLAFALAVALQAQEKHEESTTYAFLKYLARHQRADGSWGDRPEGCTCRDEKKVVVCDTEKVVPLIRALGDEDPEKRDAAEKELRALGESALPHLRLGTKDPDPEIRGRCAVLCRPFDLQAPGGGDAELTGLALLAFLGAGYSHLSKDEHDGICFGTVAKKGVQWLIARQKESGAFDPKDAAADAVAALALSEAYGMTASAALKDDAQKGIDRMAAASMKETRGVIWRGMSLKSAELAELTFPKKAYEEVLEAIQPRGGESSIVGYTVISIFIKKTKSDPRLAEIGSLDPALLETETLYFGSLAAFQYEGPNGPLWKKWERSLKARLIPQQCMKKGECERGSWKGKGFRGRLQATALNGLNFEFYYR